MALHVCVRGIGIRRSKDLRAEIGKCPASTNERKNMSTKTLRKRIALVAVSALGAGLLSVVPVSTANATAPLAQRDESNIVGNSTNGVADLSTGTLTGSAGVGSVGLLGKAGTGTTQTAVLLSSGTLSVVLPAYSGESVTASVTGGTFTKVGQGSGTATITAPANTSAVLTAADRLSLLVKPNSGASTMVVTMSTINDTNPSVTTTRVRITATIVATSAFNAYSPTFSTVLWGDGSTFTATTDATASNSRKASGQVVSGRITLADAYGNLLTSSNTSLVTATATGGALVNIGSLTVAGDRETDFNALTGAVLDFNVQQSDADAPLNSTVTISVGGTVVATKSLVITGEVKTVTASSPKIGKIGGANTDAALLAYADSAGNRVYPSSGTSVVSTTVGSVVTTASVSRYGTSAADDAAGGFTTLAVTCALGGTQKGLQVRHLNASGTVVTSNAWDAGCAGVPASMTASFDKASYKRGEVATLTLTVKDASGNAANAYDTIATAATDLTITGGPGTFVTAVAAGDKPSGSTGAKTYQFTVTLENGDYNAVIVPTTIKGANPLQANIAVKFSVTSTAGTTNEDVLKAIVSLIASINKQIAALQKALLRR
jgi:hypothetical protein